MKTYTQEEIKEILRLHLLWLNNTSEGVRVNFSDANLSYANLSRANLSYANLSYANFSYANLSRANLSYANLSRANLSDANLSRANLSDANLSYANLSCAKCDKRYISISCIGSRKGMTTYCFDDNIIWCGCFRGTLEEFEKKVLQQYHYKKNKHHKEYIGFINYLRSLK